ncbi:MAG: 30S ribosomal protein S20 [Bacilli bacterium]|jgi:small subunit ribosomal protein S20|nr:30S ribosomal protein S20 [Bacilli bacterium]
MANIKSAKKRILVTKTKKANNVPKKSSMKTAVKAAVANPSKETVNEAYKRIDKALAKNIITKNKAAREKAKVASKLNK